MTKQIFDTSGISHPTVTTAAPVGNVGIDFRTSIVYQTMGWRKLLLTIVVTGGVSDCTLWVRVARAVADDATDDVWGLFNDMFGVIKSGRVASALGIGTHHFIIPDVGGFAGIYIQSSANTMTANVSPIQEARG